MRIIEIIVSPTGQTTLQTKGYVGPECQHASRALEQALGIAVAEQKTAEFYKSVDAEQRLRH